MDANTIQIARIEIKGVAASLKESEQREQVERSLAGKDKLDVTAEMIAGYLHGDRPKEVAALLQGEKFSQATIVNIRDSLALQLMLLNFKRGGDIRGLFVADITSATVPEGEDYAEIPVHEHKVPEKESTILVGVELLQQCQEYALRVRPNTTSIYMFNTIAGRNKGEKMSESLTKLVHREWQRHQRLHDVELPDITATKARKVATSTSREIGFTKEKQETLALYVMGHRKETSDKYYDKSRKTSKWIGVTQKLRSHYEDVAGKSGQGSSSGKTMSVQVRQRNNEELAIKQSRKEAGLDTDSDESD